MKKLTLVKKVKEEMSKRGFRNPSQKEIQLYQIFGPEQFNRIIQDAFEYAWTESRIMDIPPNSPSFTELCRIKRESYVQDILDDALAMLRKRPEKRVFYEPLTRKEIEQLINERYNLRKRDK